MDINRCETLILIKSLHRLWIEDPDVGSRFTTSEFLFLKEKVSSHFYIKFVAIINKFSKKTNDRIALPIYFLWTLPTTDKNSCYAAGATLLFLVIGQILPRSGFTGVILWRQHVTFLSKIILILFSYRIWK